MTEPHRTPGIRTHRAHAPLAITLLAITLLATSPLVAQSDRDVTTTRLRDAPPVAPGELNISGVPRYFLDTIDTLSRFTTDETRTAPGLSKNNYVGKVYTVRNTPAIHIQSYLLRMLAFEGGVAEVMAAPGVTNGDGNAVQFLFVTAPDFMHPGISELVETCDLPGFTFYDGTGDDFGGGSGARAYIGKHRTASELRAILEATEISNVGAFLFPPFADDSTNMIYIVDNPAEMADNIATLELFDRPPLQLNMDVTIYEVKVGKGSNLGLDFDAFKRGLSGEIAFSALDGSFPFDGGGSFDTLLSLDATVLVDFLNYTVQTGNSRVMTSTRVTMVNSEDLPGGLTGGNRGSLSGNPAVIESITPIPYTIINTANGPVNSTNSWDELVDEKFEGVRLTLLPFIGTESSTIRVELIANSLLGFSRTANIPIVSSRTLDSFVTLPHDSIIVLGGLDRITRTDDRSGLPLLMDIPVLGYLFSKRVEREETTKVIVSLRPTLITGGATIPIPEEFAMR